MIDTVNTAFLELQGALLARSLYPLGHPRIRQAEDRALELLGETLKHQSEIMLFAVDNRVIFANEILPASEKLCETLFRALRVGGADRLTIRPGIEASELSQVLDAMAHGLSGREYTLQPTANIRLGSLKDLELGDHDPVDDGQRYEDSDQASDALSDIWDVVDNERRLDAGTLRDVVASLSRVVESSAGGVIPLAPLKQHDEYTFVHTLNVAMLSTSLGQVLGFDDHTAHDLAIAALLHDVGKRAIPSEILNKNGKFNDEEFALMKTHPIIGAQLLLNTPNVSEIAPVVAYEHHIRADGTGYPRVPRGWRLSLASRIVQIADVFDALRTDRPYRPGMPVKKIVEIMKRDVGTFFDADLLLIFLQEVVARGVNDGAGSAVAAVE